MKVVVVYKENSDQARAVIDFMHDFEHQTGRKIESLDPDSLDGERFCRAYDIVMYPTVIALADDSTMQQIWSGVPLPTIIEVSYYA